MDLITNRQALNEIAAAQGVRALLEIDLAAIRHNVDLIAQWSGGAKVMAVLKRDAYGLGARPIAHDLEKRERVQAFAVDNVAEGIDLRESGIEKPIFVIDGDIPDNAALAVRYNLIPGIAQERQLLAYQRAAAAAGLEQFPVWLVANVGFNRSGYRPGTDAFSHFLLRASACANLEVQAVYCHLTNSNGDSGISRAQIEEFRLAAEQAKAVFGPQLQTSVFASHGLMRWSEEMPSDWVRPGVLIYGEHAFLDDRIEPETRARIDRLRPAVSMRARIIHLLDFDRVEGVGYGQHTKTKPGQRIATLSVGFGSGYPIRTGRVEAIANGCRVPVFGDVGMDAMQIDVTGVPHVKLYDWVTLIGTDGGEHVSVLELARRSEMSPYQLLSRLSMHRTYRDEEE